jgi:uncharacterized membrane protein YphA (DoxX/SURF4 family)
MNVLQRSLVTVPERDLRRPALLIARLLVGGIFLIAAIPKIHAPGAFADAVRAFHLLPPALVLPFSFIVPWLELLVALYLLTGFLSRMGAVGASLLLLMFEVALLDALITGNTAHACGCFGNGSQGNPIVAFLAGGNTVTWWDVTRDAVLLALALAVAWFGPGMLALERLGTRSDSEDEE